jgi:hypothetical protein
MQNLCALFIHIVPISVKCVRNQPLYFAETMYDSMKVSPVLAAQLFIQQSPILSVKVVRNKSLYFAERLYKSMKVSL